MIKNQYIVFTDDSDKMMACIDTFDGIWERLKTKEYRIFGSIYAKTPGEAIDYVKEIITEI